VARARNLKQRAQRYENLIRFCKKLVIFKLSTDLKYLEVVQGGVSSLFFTCAPSHIGAVQRKHILKVKNS
jgi:sulfur transfer protein SufE